MKTKVTEKEYLQAIQTINDFHQQVYDEMKEIVDLLNFKRVTMQQFLKDSAKSDIIPTRLRNTLKEYFGYPGYFLDEITEEMITSCRSTGRHSWDMFDRARRIYFQQVENSLPLSLSIEKMRMIKKDRLFQLSLEESK